MDNNLSLEDAHRFAGGLFFSFKLLERDFIAAQNQIQQLAAQAEEYKGQIIALKKELSVANGPVGTRTSDQPNN